MITGEPDEPPDPAPKEQTEHPSGLPHLINPEPVKQMRPEPPAMGAQEHAAWVAGLAPGAALDLSFDGGFWDVELVRVEGKAQAARRVGKRRLRCWRTAAPRARLVAPRAQAAPTPPGARPHQLGGWPWAQQAASACRSR